MIYKVATSGEAIIGSSDKARFTSTGRGGSETVHLRLGLEPGQNPVFQLRSHTWLQVLMKLRFLMSHCRKNSVRDKVIGKKWIYLERNTLHRQSMGHLSRREQPWDKHTPQSVGRLRR